MILSPLITVLTLSIAIGFAMVVLFRYTSDQKAIHVAKDHLKAHLLAVRLFQDQLPVVLRSYGGILRGTARYLRLAFMPLLLVIVPLTALMVQVDRYLGWSPLQQNTPFLLKARTDDSAALEQLSLQLPPEIAASAPPVHIPAQNELVWRLQVEKPGNYEIAINAGGQTVSKHLVVTEGSPRISTVRLRAPYWERFFLSGESALPDSSPLKSIEVNYPIRTIEFAWIEWNWIVLFFILSLVAGFIFKTALGIEI